MTALRGAALAALACAAVVLQSVVFRHVAVGGVVPDLVLVLVVVAAIDRGPEFGALLGFGAGLLLDLAPPADQAAGRWALAFVVIGYLAGRVRQDARASTLAGVIVVGAAAFVGTSVYALSGVLVGDGPAGIDETVQVVVTSVLWDVLLAPILIPLLLWALAALEPHRDRSGLEPSRVERLRGRVSR